MANPSVSITFVNATTASASDVNTCFTDIINSLTDSTKDLSISALTCAGTATLNGAVTLGNASGDDITITGSIAASIPVKTNATYDFGSSTLGLASVYLGTGTKTTRLMGGATTSWTMTLPVNVPTTSGSFLASTTGGVTSWYNTLPPSIQVLSGTGICTIATGAKYVEIEMVAGGGGGGGTGPANVAAGAGADTLITIGGTAVFTCTGGARGVGSTGNGGAGGAATVAAGNIGFSVAGSAGNGSDTLVNSCGGHGGASYFGGQGCGSSVGADGTAGTKGGGGGGGGGNTTIQGAGGGGAGGAVWGILTLASYPTGVFSYVVGAGGAAGTPVSAGAGAQSGGAGGAGFMVVKQYFQ